MQFLFTPLIINFHKQLINQLGGLHGIHDKILLELAFAYPRLLRDMGMERDKYSGSLLLLFAKSKLCNLAIKAA